MRVLLISDSHSLVAPVGVVAGGCGRVEHPPRIVLREQLGTLLGPEETPVEPPCGGGWSSLAAPGLDHLTFRRFCSCVGWGVFGMVVVDEGWGVVVC